MRTTRRTSRRRRLWQRGASLKRVSRSRKPVGVAGVLLPVIPAVWASVVLETSEVTGEVRIVAKITVWVDLIWGRKEEKGTCHRLHLIHKTLAILVDLKS